MYCKNCGKEITEQQLYCKYCGMKIVQNSKEEANNNVDNNNNNEVSDIQNINSKKSKIYLYIVITVIILILGLLLTYFFFKRISNNANKQDKDEQLNSLYYTSTLGFSPVYYSYNSLLEKFSGPYNSQEIQDVKDDYYIKINHLGGNSGMSLLEVFNNKKEEIQLQDFNECIGSYFYSNNSLYVDTSNSIHKVDLTTAPACTIIDAGDKIFNSVKYIYANDFKNNDVYNVNGYKYFYFADSNYNSRYRLPKYAMGIKEVPKENEEIEYSYFNADTGDEVGKVYIRNNNNEMQ